MNIQFRDTENKQALCFEIDRVFTEIHSFAQQFPVDQFFTHEYGGWSVAENMAHLILVNNLVSVLFHLPSFIFSTFIGVNLSKRSKSATDISIDYHSALSVPHESGIFSPWQESKTRNPEKRKTELLTNFQKSGIFLAESLQPWQETDLDYYLTKHPVMGVVTLREMAYLTVLHCIHHIHKVYNKMQKPS